jgi:hypothetical protein
MADYGKFSLSAPFAALLAEFIFEQDGEDTVVVHDACSDVVFDDVLDESLTDLVRAAIDHNCDT